MLYQNAHRQSFSKLHPNEPHKTLTKSMRKNWESMSVNERKPWFDKAAELIRKHKYELDDKSENKTRSNSKYTRRFSFHSSSKKKSKSNIKLFSLNGKRKRDTSEPGVIEDEIVKPKKSKINVKNQRK